MAGWKADLRLLSLDLRRFSKSVDDKMLEATKEGARVWLDTVLAIVPTWSGASRATFEALAQAVGYRVTYGPIRSFTDRRRLGQGTGFGGLRREGAGKYSFYYRTDLRYLLFNEANQARVGEAGVFKGLINPTPYKFFDAGEKAFLEYAQRVDLPLVRITSQRI